MTATHDEIEASLAAALPHPLSHLYHKGSHDFMCKAADFVLQLLGECKAKDAEIAQWNLLDSMAGVEAAYRMGELQAELDALRAENERLKHG